MKRAGAPWLGAEHSSSPKSKNNPVISICTAGIQLGLVAHPVLHRRGQLLVRGWMWQLSQTAMDRRTTWLSVCCRGVNLRCSHDTGPLPSSLLNS